jgi:hypothetical protein
MKSMPPPMTRKMMTREINTSIETLIKLERRRFEIWAKARNASVIRKAKKPDEYAFNQVAWEAWLAALRLE